jgi:ABC-2 type transport system permease protein
MSATVITPAPPAELADARVTQARITLGEWIKFRSVRSTMWTLFGIGIPIAVFGVAFSSAAGSGTTSLPGGRAMNDSVTVALSGTNPAVLIAGVLGVILAASEYSTGLIRTTMTAAGRRIGVLVAKATVLTPLVFVVTTLASLFAFVVGQAAYTGDGPTMELTDSGALRIILGAGWYIAGISLIGLAIGFLVRSTAAAVGAVAATVFIIPNLTQLLMGGDPDGVVSYLPSVAGSSMMARTATDGTLSPGAGFVVFTLWIVVLMTAAIWRLRRTDA